MVVINGIMQYHIPRAPTPDSTKRLLIGKINDFVEIACMLAIQADRHKAKDNFRSKTIKDRHNSGTAWQNILE